MPCFVPLLGGPKRGQSGVILLSRYADLRLDRQLGSLSVGQEVAKCKTLH